MSPRRRPRRAHRWPRVVVLSFAVAGVVLACGARSGLGDDCCREPAGVPDGAPAAERAGPDAVSDATGDDAARSDVVVLDVGRDSRADTSPADAAPVATCSAPIVMPFLPPGNQVTLTGDTCTGSVDPAPCGTRATWFVMHAVGYVHWLMTVTPSRYFIDMRQGSCTSIDTGCAPDHVDTIVPGADGYAEDLFVNVSEPNPGDCGPFSLTVVYE